MNGGAASPTVRTTTPTNKPLRAKVDLSQFTSPSVSNAGINTPSPRIRTHNIRESGFGVGGAPSSATATTTTTTTMAKRAAATHANSSSSPQHSPLIRAQSSTSSLSSTRANPTWSPNFAASTSTRSASPTRPPPSPPQRYGGIPTMATVAKDLKGQNDAFPKTIDYLPLSVSVRKVHSPPLRSSPSHLAQSSGHGHGHGPLASSSSSSYFPPGLSTSPGSTSTTSSPLTSPSISTLSADSHVNIHGANSINGGLRRVKSTISSGVQRAPGADPSTPVSVLLPAFSVESSTTTPVPLSRTTAGMRTRSPQREAVHTTTASRTSPTRLVLSPRPASATSTASPRHARSHSATSMTSSIFSSTGSDTIALASPYVSNPLHVVASTSSWGRKDSTASTGTRSSGMSDQGLMGIDWSRPQHFEEEDEEDESDRDSSFDDGAHENEDGTSGSNRRRRALADQTVMLPSPSLGGGYAPQRPELVNQSNVDEMSEEKEARIQRKILDLEITNKSLLSINASLEQLKIKHTAELRDLRRRMRESNAGLALAPFRTPQSPRKTKAVSTNGSISPFEGMSSDEDEDEEGDEEDEDGEVAWERILDKDPHYAAVCQTIEALLRRGKHAIESKVEEKDLGGRVLHAMEIQQEGDSSDDLVRWVDAEVQTDGHFRTLSSTSVGAPAASAAGRKMVNGWQR